MFTQSFGTPHYHPKSQPFIDHVLKFSLHDGRIWIRNYQIVLERENKVKDDRFDPELVEIGPRIVLNLQRIQEGPFSGPAIYLNPGEFIKVIFELSKNVILKISKKKIFVTLHPANKF